MNKNEVGMQFLEESKKQAIRARDRINHCLNQLDNDDVWWTPQEGCNCIGIILQHLCGNLRQWIISGVGGARDIRERPKEFLIEEKLPKAIIQKTFNEVVADVLETYAQFDPDRLLEQKRIQGFDEILLGAIYQTMTHFEVHAGQIVYITRLRLDNKYQVYWRPSNKEQGA